MTQTTAESTTPGQKLLQFAAYLDTTREEVKAAQGKKDAKATIDGILRQVEAEAQNRLVDPLKPTGQLPRGFMDWVRFRLEIITWDALSDDGRECEHNLVHAQTHEGCGD